MRHQHVQHHRAAVALELQHILPCIAVGRWEKNRQHLVDGVALRIPNADQVRLARLQFALGQLSDQGPKLFAA